ncbi:MAG: 30S ribosome-binding factor RbfA [Candidatus Aminicenantes bacterium]|nr:30S ribosome-binding factor RbfA [Candidatus Aminicenantes bacterium]
MTESRRQKKVASLIKETLSQFLIESLQDSASSLITISKVNMTSDLKTAHVFLTYIGQEIDKSILKTLEIRKGYLRKYIASKTKLKYNPMLIFSLDSTRDYEENIDKILEQLKKNETRTD